jgi:hypothetical protein
MRTGTYRLVVIGSLVSSFLVGMHTPMVHEILEHGAAARWDVLTATLLLAVATIAGAWTLLRANGGAMTPRA